MASIRMKFYSASLKTRTNVNVLIPTLLPDQNGANNPGQSFDGYYASHGNYPVLYLLHGTFGDEGDWQRYSRIEDYARTRNVVVVMPYGENSCYRDTKSGKNYETYITQELPQVIQWMFPVSRRREDTFIAGLSMGGGAAVRLGLSHPDLYGCVAGLSSDFGSIAEKACQSDFSVWSFAFEGAEVGKGTSTDSFSLAEKLKKSGTEQPKLYLGCGTEDFLYQDNCKFHQYLNELGMEHVFSTGTGNHNWNFWDPEIVKVLDWLPINGASGTERKLGF